MKRAFFAWLAILTLCLSLAVPALAAKESIAGYYAADSCTKDGEPYRCDEDYLILYEDGTGIAAFSGEECPMTWKRKGNRFTMEDEEGYCLDGTYDSGAITGRYGGYDFVYVFTHGLEEPQPTEEPEADSVPPASEDPEKDSVPAAVEALDLRYYPVVSCEMYGREYPMEGNYLLLYPAGGGMVVSRGCAYFIEWSIDGDDFSFTDHTGESAAGVVEGDRLTAQYRECEYVWEVSEEYAPITFLAPEHWDGDLPNVLDRADILTDEQEAELGKTAAAITEQYHCKVYIVTVDDMHNYSHAPSITLFNDEIMTGYRTGYGADRNAIMLLMSMAERDYDLMADGPVGNAAFTDFGRDYMAGKFKDNFKHDDWYGGFSDYLTWCEKLLKASADGKPIDVDNNPNITRNSILAAIVVSAILSLVVSCVLEGRMKSVKQKSEAKAYVPEGGFEVTFRKDTFTHKTVSRVYDPPSRSSGGSSGGTSVSSSGRSSSSGKF